ncbi:MAG: AtpZ/AtpI family protein [Tissierellia bacterium]|nr:AtpZ/AtpI family protein [Tissierellia bacterium]
MKNLLLISQLAYTILAPILVGLFLGGLLDKWLKTGGFFAIFLMLLGVVSGFINAYKLIMKLNKEEKDER